MTSAKQRLSADVVPGLNTAIIVTAPTLAVGIQRAFLVNVVLAVGGS